MVHVCACSYTCICRCPHSSQPMLPLMRRLLHQARTNERTHAHTRRPTSSHAHTRVHATYTSADVRPDDISDAGANGRANTATVGGADTCAERHALGGLRTCLCACLCTRTFGCFQGFCQMLKTGEHRNSGQHLGEGDIPERKQQYTAGSQACVCTPDFGVDRQEI